jgi:hypothetical protein
LPRRNRLAVAASVVLITLGSLAVVNSFQHRSVSQGSARIAIECFHGPSVSSPSVIKPLAATLEGSCVSGSAANHSSLYSSFACVRWSGQVALFVTRDNRHRGTCEAIGLAPFVGNIHRPDIPQLVENVRQLGRSSSCLSPVNARAGVARAIGLSGAGSWSVRLEGHQGCLVIHIHVHERVISLINPPR